MVKVGKLWGDAKFASLSPISKLLYCYLISQPSISTLGFLDLDTFRISLDLKLDLGQNVDELLEELSSSEYIKFFFSSDSRVSVIIVDHYKSLSKSKSNIRKAIEEGQKSKGKIRDIFLGLFNPEDFKSNSFTPPTPKEVSDYALTLGYIVNGKSFVEHYGNNDWYDKNDKKVRNWKSKVSKVWCREENKLETVEGAPKGFEYFFVEVEEGNRVYPQSWRNGLPQHSNHIYSQYLIDEFNERLSSKHK